MKGDVSDGGVPAALGCCSIEGRRHRLYMGGGGGAISSGEDRLFLNPHQTVSTVRSRYFLHENLGFSPILYCRAAPAASCTFLYVLRKAYRLQPKTSAGKSPGLSGTSS